MKRLYFLFCGLVLHLAVNAQACDSYYFMVANSTVEQSHFDDKGKLTLRTEFKVSEVKPADNGSQATVGQTMYDKKNKVISESKANVRCDGDNLYIDMKFSMPAGPVAPKGEVSASSNSVYLPYPRSMKVGDKLDDARFSMSIDQGSIMQDVELFIRNRKAEGEETITTPAGTWQCIRISYDMEMITRAAGIRIPVRMKGVEWYAPGFGVVKTMSMNKNGKPAGTSEITAIRK
ncbi:MAG: hypothetical protein EOP49_04645 [Sphingobacteriales bacterium]|nr:MAG: hypothetical protein EOP49_04645 [Sphingobacteriales bacterium]